MGAKAHFGASGYRIQTDEAVEMTEAVWSITKLHKILDAPLTGSLKDDRGMAWGIAEHIMQEKYRLDPNFREQMEQIKLPSDHVAFLEKFLTVDPNTRPSTAAALALPFLSDSRQN
jgi:serine/threonine protein kinase